MILSPMYSDDTSDTWLEAFVHDTDKTLVTVGLKRPLGNWHLKSRPRSGAIEWWHYLRSTIVAFTKRPDVLVTVLPQFAVVAGIIKRVFRLKTPLVAYWFNTGHTEGLRNTVTRFGLQSVDQFVVHYRREADLYAGWFGAPKEKFRFAYFPKPPMSADRALAPLEPYVFATGTGYRDYATFFAAVTDLPIRVIVAPGRSAVKGLTWPSNVDVRFEITLPEIRALAKYAVANVIPLTTESELPAGGVTYVEGLMLGSTMVVSDTSGVREYLENGETALLVPPLDVRAMRAALQSLIDDPTLGKSLGENAQRHGHATCLDVRCGEEFGRLLDDVRAARERKSSSSTQ